MTTAPTAPPAEHTPHNSGSGLPAPRLYRGKTASDWAIHVVLTVVMAAALAVGTWSIYTLLKHQLGAPAAVAILGCGMFDVAALFFALLSQRYAVTTDSGLAPRTAMLAMICLSSWVNWRHGQMEGWGTVGSVILAAAPVIAELSFEMFHRYAHREALRRLGRVAQALPVLGKWSWLAHPFRSRRALDAHIQATLTEHEAIADRRTELAAARARQIVTVPAEVHEPAALAAAPQPRTERAAQESANANRPASASAASASPSAGSGNAAIAGSQPTLGASAGTGSKHAGNPLANGSRPATATGSAPANRAASDQPADHTDVITAYQELKAEHGKAPSDAALGERLGVSRSRAQQLRTAAIEAGHTELAKPVRAA